MNTAVTPWWQTLRIRKEITGSSGAIDDVQMSLFRAVHGAGSDRPPYADPAYYGEITHPSPQFIELMAKVAVRLGAANYTAAPGLWRLDQAMGGGKSHGLIGLYHLADRPADLRRTDVGQQAIDLAEKIAGSSIPADLGRPQTVVLACDNMTAGKGVQQYDGPATTLYERFLWRLFGKDYVLYERYQPYHADKSKIVEALKAAGRPVLILIDEIMHYIGQLSENDLHDLAVKDMAFLRALLDSVNDVPHVAMVVVMIASDKDRMDLDYAGRSRRDEIDQLLDRNGWPGTINDNNDFADILRRRLFEAKPPDEVLAATASVFARAVSGPWQTKVFDALGAPWTREWAPAVDRCYPFHPQLIHLAEQEWAKLAGFQRVRSTIRIFAATAYTLAQRAAQGEWVPLLIGPGDLPLSDSTVREAVIGSGLIRDTRAQANYRSIASADVVGGDGQSGAARMLDREHASVQFASANPRAAERAATCLFLCSIVGSRGGGRQGASEPEMKAAMFVPSPLFGLADADSVLAQLKDIDGGGLASAEPIPGKGGQPPRLFLSTRQTLPMLMRAARGTITDDERDAELSRLAERLISTGSFKKALFIPAGLNRTAREVLETAGIDDARATRLVVLDPQQFSLLNGVDQNTRAAIRAAMGIGTDKMPVQWASSAVFTVTNTQRRGIARGAAVTYLAWDRVSEMADVKADAELADKASNERSVARRNLDAAVKRAYQHVMYLDMNDEAGGEPRIDRMITFEQENQTALDGTIVWKALVEAGKAFDVGAFSGKALVHNLRDDDYGRPLDEVRDLFWSTPRMPLLPGGDTDLQRAIYEAANDGKVRLVGSDGSERHITSPVEIGIGLSSLRLAKPLPAEPAAPGSGGDSSAGSTGTPSGEGTMPAGRGPTGPPGGQPPSPPVSEKQITFALRTSLSADNPRDALYALLNELADRVDDGSASYAEVMIKMRVSDEAADNIATLIRHTGSAPDVRDV